MSDEQQAFPTGDPTHGGNNGMTLRDWFAGQALAHCDFCHRLPSQVNEESTESQKRLVTEYRRIVAEQCYDMADAMMKAREQPADAGKGET